MILMQRRCFGSTYQKLLSGRYGQATAAEGCIFGGQKKWCILTRTNKRKCTLRQQHAETVPRGTGAAPLRALSSERHGWREADFCLSVFSMGMVLDVLRS